jgi:hypothetical protein
MYLGRTQAGPLHARHMQNCLRLGDMEELQGWREAKRQRSASSLAIITVHAQIDTSDTYATAASVPVTGSARKRNA